MIEKILITLAEQNAALTEQIALLNHNLAAIVQGSAPTSLSQVAAEAVAETTTEAVNQSVPESVSQSVTESASEVVTQSESELVSESTSQPVVQDIGVTIEDVRAALREYAAKHGMPATREIVAKFGAAAVSELDPACFVELINELKG